MAKLLIVAHEPVGAMMTGPAIRCLELARALSHHVDVTLAAPEAPGSLLPPFRLVTYRRDDPDSLVSLALEADAILVSGFLLSDFPDLERLDRPLIVDVFDPFPIENMELHCRRPMAEQLAIIERDFAVLKHLLQAGDFFICGSERQRDYWLGMLAASGRLNPLNFEADPSFRKLTDVVSMGIPDEPPVAGDGVKGAFPGIGPEDFLAVWPGGVWDWLDPLTAVEAVRRLSGEAPNIKLLFLGLRHPHPERVGAMRNPEAIIDRAEAAALLGRQVFFNDWTPYEDRARYLLDADVAVSLHFDHAESRLAVRARLLDCLWTGTPVIATEGDVIAEAMAQRGLAMLVPPRDAVAVAEALMEWRSWGDNRARLAGPFKEMASRYHWPVVCRPLVSFLHQSCRAPDHAFSPETDLADVVSKPVSHEGPGNLENEPSSRDELVRALGEARQQLREREASLKEACDLLDRIRRGKVMRLMNAVQSVFGRSTK